MKLFPNFTRHHLITHTNIPLTLLILIYRPVLLLCGLIIEPKINQHHSISTGSNPFFLLESYCVSEDDSRWVAMCNHALNKRGSHSKDALLGMEECQSPFGIYELKIPIDKKLACDTNRITTTNCKDLDVGSCFSHIRTLENCLVSRFYVYNFKIFVHYLRKEVKFRQIKSVGCLRPPPSQVAK